MPDLFGNNGDWVFRTTHAFFWAMREQLGRYENTDFEDAYAMWDGL